MENNENTITQNEGQDANASMSKEQGKITTLQYKDEMQGERVHFNPIADNSFYDNYTVDASLSEFLSRPVIIDTINWVEGSGLSSIIRPWSLYFNNPVIKNKLENFAFLSCNLHIKIVINASPFYYGAAMASYQPLPLLKPGEIVEVVGYTGHHVPLSQRPHVWIYPQTNQGGEMVLPFFLNKDWIKVGLIQDFLDMGQLRFFSFTPLINANSVAGSNCTIQVMAWAEDVRLCGPTVFAALQSGKVAGPPKEDLSVDLFKKVNVADPQWDYVKVKALAALKQLEREMKRMRKLQKDIREVLRFHGVEIQMARKKGPITNEEYMHDGIISKPASAISRAAGYLSNVPGIGLYARATEMVANTVAGVASYFGYTNVPVVSDVVPFKDVPFHAFASNEISQPIDKLTLDPKCELSIDPRVAGLSGQDELILKHLFMKESFFDQFTWTAAGAPNSQIYKLNVTPSIFRVDGITTGRVVQATPLHHFTRLFSWWRGSLVYHFRVICSRYHRGRLMFQWDPYANLGVAPPAMESNYTYVLDIAEEPEIEICVPYLAHTSFLSTDSEITDVNFGSGTIDAVSDLTDNGMMTVTILTEQISPVSSADIIVLASIRAGDDFEVNAPQEAPQDFTQFPIQSEQKYGAPECSELFNKNPPAPELNLVYMGKQSPHYVNYCVEPR
jgi:hypothetical protein